MRFHFFFIFLILGNLPLYSMSCFLPSHPVGTTAHQIYVKNNTLAFCTLSIGTFMLGTEYMTGFASDPMKIFGGAFLLGGAGCFLATHYQYKKAQPIGFYSKRIATHRNSL